MDEMIGLLNAIAAIVFLAAVAVALRLRPDQASRGVKLLFVISAGAFAFVTISNTLEHGFGLAGLDAAEDYMEILFVPVLVYTVYVLNLHVQYGRERRSGELARLQYDLLLQILDINPVGTLVADDHGKITFASEGARRALGLNDKAPEDSPAAWRLLTPEGVELKRAFGSFCDSGVLEDVHLVLVRPDGRRYDLMVSAAPMADRTGKASACVVAIEDVETRRAAFAW